MLGPRVGGGLYPREVDERGDKGGDFDTKVLPPGSGFALPPSWKTKRTRKGRQCDLYYVLSGGEFDFGFLENVKLPSVSPFHSDRCIRITIFYYNPSNIFARA